MRLRGGGKREREDVAAIYRKEGYAGLYGAAYDDRLSDAYDWLTDKLRECGDDAHSVSSHSSDDDPDGDEGSDGAYDGAYEDMVDLYVREGISAVNAEALQGYGDTVRAEAADDFASGRGKRLDARRRAREAIKSLYASKGLRAVRDAAHEDSAHGDAAVAFLEDRATQSKRQKRA